jgi:hypothetical protein
MNKIIIALIGIAASLGFLAGWQFTQPAPDSGWLLFVAIIAAFGIISHLRSHAVSAFAAAALTAGFGYGWFIDRGIQNAGWLLFAAIICGLAFFDSIFSLANGQTVKPVEEDDDE